MAKEPFQASGNRDLRKTSEIKNRWSIERAEEAQQLGDSYDMRGFLSACKAVCNAVQISGGTVYNRFASIYTGIRLSDPELG